MVSGASVFEGAGVDSSWSINRLIEDQIEARQESQPTTNPLAQRDAYQVDLLSWVRELRPHSLERQGLQLRQVHQVEHA